MDLRNHEHHMTPEQRVEAPVICFGQDYLIHGFTFSSLRFYSTIFVIVNGIIGLEEHFSVPMFLLAFRGLTVSFTDGADEFWEGVLEKDHEQEGVQDPEEATSFVQRNLDRFDPCAKIPLRYKLVKDRNTENFTLDVSKVSQEGVAHRRARVPLVRVSDPAEVSKARRLFLDAVSVEHAARRAAAAEHAEEMGKLRSNYEMALRNLNDLADVAQRQREDLVQRFAQVLNYKKEAMRKALASGLGFGGDAHEFDDHESQDAHSEALRHSPGGNEDENDEDEDDDDDDDGDGKVPSSKDPQESYQTTFANAYETTATQVSPSQRRSHASPLQRNARKASLMEPTDSQSPSKQATRRTTPNRVKRRVPSSSAALTTLTGTLSETMSGTQMESASLMPSSQTVESMPPCFTETTSDKDPQQKRYFVLAPAKTTREQICIGKVRDWRNKRVVATVWRKWLENNPKSVDLDDVDPYIQEAVRQSDTERGQGLRRTISTRGSSLRRKRSFPTHKVSEGTNAATNAAGCAVKRPRGGSANTSDPKTDSASSFAERDTAVSKQAAQAAQATQATQAQGGEHTSRTTKVGGAKTSLLLFATSQDEDEDGSDGEAGGAFGWQI
ncbi:Hypothetical Protein FCC1311_081782 [Hondaea fermentalgiana]|uniref:Uncharacterized protein n=1 Tax=Hondaea fermentalgiana TaxID=2315210 RepID=A0A2R5GTH4_9STRA|nr:Hypothetical Protein FCC1311_081782 [Hondaea fermentalgiana]|eukprot:GBG31953.1 Hypothetical Protein FCC1311_081782 [Hondaea fermentalgiana]